MNQIILRLIVMLILCLVISGCSGKADIDEVQGTVTVQVPAQDTASSYRMITVDLLEITNLREVAGKFARFFYTPGANETGLVGDSPRARFVKSGNTFTPADLISAQMAAIYYHMQRLAQLDANLGVASINHWPRSIGLETQIVENDRSRKNNAFYDGQTDAMMFVPFTSSELPISVNAGIIAHEHFHSLFYKMVIKPAITNKKIMVSTVSAHEPDQELVLPTKMVVPRMLSEKKKALLFNEVYLRGLNEGLADFWGWIYTDDPNFMKWSLPDFSGPRELSIGPATAGQYMTQEKINEAVDEAIQISAYPRLALVDYSYRIGTPHAKFLKQWALLQMQSEKIDASEAKMKIGKEVIAYMKSLAEKIKNLEENETLNAGDFFEHFVNKALAQKTLDKESCEFVIKYLNFRKTNAKEIVKCEEKDSHNVVLKP